MYPMDSATVNRGSRIASNPICLSFVFIREKY